MAYRDTITGDIIYKLPKRITRDGLRVLATEDNYESLGLEVIVPPPVEEDTRTDEQKAAAAQAARIAYFETDDGWATIEESLDLIYRMLEILQEAKLPRAPLNSWDAIQLFKEREDTMTTVDDKLALAKLTIELAECRRILYDEDRLNWNDVLAVAAVMQAPTPPEDVDADGDGTADNPKSFWSRIWGWVTGR
jgi:hypothetical protein